MEKRKGGKTAIGTPAKIAIVAGTVIVLLIIAALVAQGWLRGKIAEALQGTPFNIEGGTYDVSYDKVRVNLASRSVVLDGVELHPRSSRAAATDGPVPTLRVTADRIAVSGIKYKRGRRGVKPAVSARTIEIDSPRLTYDGIPRRGKTGGSSFRLDSLSSLAGRSFNEINVGSLEINDLAAVYVYWSGADKLSWTTDGLDLQMKEVSVGRGRDYSSAFLFSSSVRLEADRISHSYKDGAMKLVFESPAISTFGKSLTLGAFRIIPQYPKGEFASRAPGHEDWTQVELTGIEARNIDYLRLQHEGALYADSLLVAGGMIESYKNRNIPQARKIKPLLYQPLQRLGIGVSIPVIRLEDIDARYDELAEGASEPGIMRFTDISATLKGATNRPASVEESFRLDANGRCMGQGLVNVAMLMPADSLNDNFSISAVMQEMDMQWFNEAARPLGNLSIDSGRITGFDMAMNATSASSDITVVMTYDGLHVTVLRADNHAERRFISFIANEFLVKESNPDAAGLRTGSASHERDPYKSHFNYIWKSIFEAVKKVII